MYFAEQPVEQWALGNDPTKAVSALLESLARDGSLCRFLLCLDRGNSNQILEEMD